MIASEIAEGSFHDHPFPYFVTGQALTNEASNLLLDWFERDAPWQLVEEEFYEQYEFNLRESEIPKEIESICGQQNLALVRNFVESTFQIQHRE